MKKSEPREILKEIEKYIQHYVRSRFSGMYESLNLSCLALSGKTCVNLLLNNPLDLRSVLETRYSDKYSLLLVLGHFFLKPLLIKLDMLEAEDELKSLFLNNPDRFRDKLLEILGAPSKITDVFKKYG